MLLAQVPPPTLLHTQAVAAVIENVYREHALTEEALANRDSVLQHLRDIVSKHFTGEDGASRI